MDPSPPLAMHHSTSMSMGGPRYAPAVHDTGAHPRRGREDETQIRYIEAPMHNSHYAPPHPQDRYAHRRRHRSTSRSPHSRSRSRGSSISLDELLIEATTGDDPDHASQQQQQQRALPPHPSSHHRIRHRSQSPARGRDYNHHHLAVPQSHSQHASRSRGSSVVPPQQLHPSASISGPGVSPSGSGGGHSPAPPGPLAQPGSVQTYQTHIFAPPVTGAPVKKPKGGSSQGNPASGVTSNGSVLTLGKFFCGGFTSVDHEYLYMPLFYSSVW